MMSFFKLKHTLVKVHPLKANTYSSFCPVVVDFLLSLSDDDLTSSSLLGIYFFDVPHFQDLIGGISVENLKLTIILKMIRCLDANVIKCRCFDSKKFGFIFIECFKSK